MGTAFFALRAALTKAAGAEEYVFSESEDTPLHKAIHTNPLLSEVGGGLLGAVTGAQGFGKLTRGLPLSSGQDIAGTTAGALVGAYGGRFAGQAAAEDSARRKLKRVRMAAEKLREVARASGQDYDLRADLLSEDPDTALQKQMLADGPLGYDRAPFMLLGGLAGTMGYGHLLSRLRPSGLAAQLLPLGGTLSALGGAGLGYAASKLLTPHSATVERTLKDVREALRSLERERD